MSILITADSTCDLPINLLDKYNIKIMPLNIDLDEESYFDGINIKAKNIFDFVDKTGTLPKTAARSTQNYIDFFNEVRCNNDFIIHLSMSSELSSSYNNAKLASEEIENLIVIDSKNLSTGYGLLVLKTAELALHNLQPSQIVNIINNTTSKVQASFVINSLNYLHKGGRCSALSAFGANILKIKPMIQVKNGKMGVAKKYTGKLNDCLNKYFNDLFIENKNFETENAFITYSSKDNIEIELFKNKLLDYGFKNVYVNQAGCTVCCHCGPQTMGILFIKN